MIKYGFFDAKMYNGEPDRVYASDDINSFFDGVLTDGIFATYKNSFAIATAEGMQISIEAGKARVYGHWIVSDAVEYLDITPSHPTRNRYTRIVIRYNRASRLVELATVDGDCSDTPSLPELTQTADIYELPIANILVRAGASKVGEDDITDARVYVSTLPAAARVNYRRYEYVHNNSVKEIPIPDTYAYNIDTNLLIYANGLLLSSNEYEIVLDDTSSGYKIVFKNTMNADADIIIVMIS